MVYRRSARSSEEQIFVSGPEPKTFPDDGKVDDLPEALAVAYQESDIRSVKALIVGPPGTPYEFGFFEVTPSEPDCGNDLLTPQSSYSFLLSFLKVSMFICCFSLNYLTYSFFIKNIQVAPRLCERPQLTPDGVDSTPIFTQMARFVCKYV